MSTVSVVIPCFDLGRYLPAAVASVRAQTREAAELVIVDDGSTDPRTLDELERCRAEGVWVLRTSNQGASAARNHGIAAASSDYVVCLDADDELRPAFLERTTEALERSPGAAVAATHVEFFGASTGSWRPGGHSVVAMLARNCIPSASLFRRACWEEVGGYGDLPACQDWDFFLSMVERGWTWVVVPETLYRYRQRNGSLSAHREANRRAIVAQLLERHRRTYEGHWPEVFLEMDAEIARLRGRIRALESASHPPSGGAPARRSHPPGASSHALAADGEGLAGLRRLVDDAVPMHAGVVEAGHVTAAGLSRRTRTLSDPGDNGGPAYPEPATGDEALALVEELRSRGGEFVVVPKAGAGAPPYVPELLAGLRARYPVAGEDARAGVVFDITPYRTFSVVICTYGRSELVARAIESVLAQDYPSERLELILVDNGSPDGTRAVLDELCSAAAIRCQVLTEERNGLSFARNRGIAAAAHEYVAFLDDDAMAEPDWVRSLNRVINERHALVVGGRVEKSFAGEPGPPAWFEPQYVKHFFGVNYRDRGRPERVLRIRYPLYLTGANIAYARRLFEHFGGFDPRLGRDATTLRAGEETYLNLILERNDVPIYYSDDACVHHFVGADRLSRRHILRKAYWSGRSNARMHALFFGLEAARAWARSAARDTRALLARAARSPLDPESFASVARALHNAAFIMEGGWLRGRRVLGDRSVEALPERSWGPPEWLAEIGRWPEGSEKLEALSALHLSLGDEQAAREALEQLDRFPRPEHSEVDLEALWGPLRRLEYERLVVRVRAACERVIPGGERVLVVSRGDEDLVELRGRRGEHFPQDRSGEYAGHYPPDGIAALEHLEALRRDGARYLVLPATALWWLEHYEELAEHLERAGSRVCDEPGTCLIYELAPGSPAPAVAATVHAHASG
jgi:glycosyltransferase involved in cell wall biosynthesis